MNKEGNFTPILRHLRDEDNFLKFGRDGEILPGQDEDARMYAEELVADTRKENKEAIIFLSSTFRRTMQTADLIVTHVREIDPELKVRISTNSTLGNLDDGELNIPNDYKPGDRVTGYPLGKDIFAKEVFGTDKPNLLYKFGDPILQEDGQYKYPELVDCFKKLGENYRDFFMRTLKFISSVRENLPRLSNKTKVVVVSHGLQYEMFYDLSKIAEKLKDETIPMKEGDLSVLCWRKYNERRALGESTGKIRYIDISILDDERIRDILEHEINYLSKLA